MTSTKLSTKKTYMAAALLILLVVISSAVGGYFYWQDLNRKEAQRIAKAKSDEIAKMTQDEDGQLRIFGICFSNFGDEGVETILGYENKSSERVDLDKSLVYLKNNLQKSQDGIELIHTHFMLSNKNMRDLNVISQDSSSELAGLFNTDDPNLMNKLSGPIMYFNPGSLERGMVLKSLNKDQPIIWEIHSGQQDLQIEISSNSSLPESEVP
jgi:hypothetical protein